MLNCPDCGCDQKRNTLPEGLNTDCSKRDLEYAMMVDCPMCGRIEKYAYTDRVWIPSRGEYVYSTRNLKV